MYDARVIAWEAPRSAGMRVKLPVCDIALLKVDLNGRSLPGDLRLHTPQDFEGIADAVLEGQRLHSYGFARTAGGFAEGKVQGEDGNGWLHLVGAGEAGDFVAPGFSGAPVFDAQRRHIVGMVVSVDANRGRRLAFLQSTRNLRRACPELARPYRGLKSFEEEDAEFFFGRETFVEQMVNKARAHSLLGVTAASGAGKSSAIRAGLLPRLRADRSSVVLIMRPGNDPWKALLKALLHQIDPGADLLAADDRADEMAVRLRKDSGKLKDYASDLLKKADAERLMIFVDQFDELFTLAGHEQAPTTEEKGSKDIPRSAREDFRDLMVATASLKGSAHIQWLFSLRGDFADRAFRPPAFVTLLGDGNVMLPDMRPEELRTAIRSPAQALDVDFEKGTDEEPGLVERIARDAGATVGALPLMQHVLEQLWRGLEVRKNPDGEVERELSHAAYDSLGGLQGSLNRHAEQVFGELSQEEQGLVRRMFSRLVSVKEDGEATRRVARRKELGEAMWAVAAKLADERSRLLVMSGGWSRNAGAADANPTQTNAAPDETVEVAHEALLRHWGRLTRWITDDRRFLLWRQRLEQQKRDYDNAPDKSGLLLSGAPLQTALSWLEARKEDISADEQAFINASKQEQQRIAADKALAEARATTKQWQLIYALLAIAVILVGATVTGFFLNKQTTSALASASAARDDLKTESDQLAGALRAQTAATVGVAQQHRNAIRNETIGLAAMSRAASLRQSYFDAVNLALASWPREGDTDRPFLQESIDAISEALPGLREIAKLELTQKQGSALEARFLPSSYLFVVHPRSGPLELWDSQRWLRLRSFGQADDSFSAMKISPDGKILAAGLKGGVLRTYDLATGSLRGEVAAHLDDISDIAFSPDSKLLATASFDKTTKTWNVSDLRKILILPSQNSSIASVRFSPDGKLLLARSNDATDGVVIWDLKTNKPRRKISMSGNLIESAEYLGNGDRVVTTSVQSAIVTNIQTGETVPLTNCASGQWGNAFVSPDRSRLLLSCGGKSAKIYEAQPLNYRVSISGFVGGATFSSDNAFVVTSAMGGAIPNLERR